MISSFAGAGEMRARTSGNSIRDAAENASGERKNRAKTGVARGENRAAEVPNGVAPMAFEGARKRNFKKFDVDFAQ